MKQFKDCCLTCISKCNDPVDKTDYNSVTDLINIICFKSRLVQKHGSDKGPEKPPGENVLQSNSGSQFFECTEFAETFAIPETSN